MITRYTVGTVEDGIPRCPLSSCVAEPYSRASGWCLVLEDNITVAAVTCFDRRIGCGDAVTVMLNRATLIEW